MTLRPRTTTCSSALTPHWRNLRQAQSVSRSYRRCRTRFSRVAVAQCASHPSKSMTLWRRCLAGTTFTALASQSGLRSASGRARCARARQSLHDSGSKEVRECPRDSPGDHILPIVCITQLVYIAYRPTLRWSSHHQPDRPQRESVSRCEAGAVSTSLSTKSSFGPITCRTFSVRTVHLLGSSACQPRSRLRAGHTEAKGRGGRSARERSPSAARKKG